MKVSRSTVRDQAVENIKQAIQSGFLKPGQRLVERDLCDLCGISRTSVREALRILEGEKLIINLPHKGPRVAMPTPEEAEQIYEMRGVLEALLGRHAALNATDGDVGEMHEAVESFAGEVAREDLAGMVSSTEVFYATLARVADRPIAGDLLQTLQARISALRATSMSSKGRGAHSAQEMRAIVRAIAKRDPEAAANACIHHVHQAAKSAKIRMAESGRLPRDAAPPPAARPGRRAKSVA